MADVTNLFNSAYIRKPRDITKYTLMRGVTDFANLNQYNLYESGYSYLIVTQVPKFMEDLAAQNDDYRDLMNNYLHVLEYEFRGLDGLENMTGETSELTNGISQLNVITKTNLQSASTFTMRYFEKAGSVITRVHELFLRGVKDPRSQFKHYNGLVGIGNDAIYGPGKQDVGYENETFSLLYINTDNTGLQIEKSVFIIGAQPTTAELSIYNTEKGTIEFKEVGIEMNGFPITGTAIDQKAYEILNYINDKANAAVYVEKDSAALYRADGSSRLYSGIDDIGPSSMRTPGGV